MAYAGNQKIIPVARLIALAALSSLSISGMGAKADFNSRFVSTDNILKQKINSDIKLGKLAQDRRTKISSRITVKVTKTQEGKVERKVIEEATIKTIVRRKASPFTGSQMSDIRAELRNSGEIPRDAELYQIPIKTGRSTKYGLAYVEQVEQKASKEFLQLPLLQIGKTLPTIKAIRTGSSYSYSMVLPEGANLVVMDMPMPPKYYEKYASGVPTGV